MEGRRRYPDEPEPLWYSGMSPYESQSTNPYDSGVPERPSGAFRLPDPPADGYPPAYPGSEDPTPGGSHALSPGDTGTRIPVRGPEYPTIRPTGATGPTSAPSVLGGSAGPTSAPPMPAGPASAPPMPTGPAAAAEPTGVVPPIAERPHVLAEAVYHARRSVSAVLIAAVTIALLIPVLLLLVHVTFVVAPSVRGIVPAVLLAVGLPLAGGGLFALARGGPAGRDIWLRPPAIYLPVGLFLLLAAGIAVA